MPVNPGATPVVSQIRRDSDCPDAELVTRIQCAWQVISLRDQDCFFYTEDLSSAITRIVGTLPGIIQHDVFIRYAQAEGIIAHRPWLVVINEPVVTTHQQFIHFARKVKLSSGGNTIAQHRRGSSIPPQSCAKNDGDWF